MSKMFLPIVAVWILLADGRCFNCPRCCDKGSDEVRGEIVKCFEQKPGPACAKHFYIVVVNSGEHLCINPDSQWLKNKRDQEKLSCSSTDEPELDVGAKTKGRCNVCPDCCYKGSDEVRGEIVECYEQKPGPACAKHFYRVKIKHGVKYLCINPNSKWFEGVKTQKNLTCSPGVAHRGHKLHVTAKPKKRSSDLPALLTATGKTEA